MEFSPESLETTFPTLPYHLPLTEESGLDYRILVSVVSKSFTFFLVTEPERNN